MSVRQSEKGLHETGYDGELSSQDLHSILELFPDSEEVAEALYRLRNRNSFTDMKRGELYPEVIGGATRLRRTIADVYEIEVVQAQPNFGCNGCIDTFLAYIQRLELTSNGKHNGFLVATPTYFRYYHKIESLRMKLLDVSFDDDYRYPVSEIVRRANEEAPSCLFLVTPNNPTGLPIPDDELFEILDNVPDDLSIVIDRTCVNIEAEVSTRTLLKKYRHKQLAVFHSLSKYYAMSHLRIGFSVFSNVTLAAEVERYLPFGLNLEAMLKATYILNTTGEFKPNLKILRFIEENRKLMQTFLDDNPDYECSDFKSNYAVLRLPNSISSIEFNRRLLDKGIFVMPGHELPSPDKSTVRIHTGGPPEHLWTMLEIIKGWT